MIDTEALLQELPHRLPERIVAEVERAIGAPAALYAVDLSGDCIRQIAGAAGSPGEIPLTGALGPELDSGGAEALAESVAAVRPGAVVAPLFLRGRATCVLIADEGARDKLEAIAAAAAPAVELAPGFTDVFDRVRRGRPATPAAEIQQDLLAPRLSEVSGAHLAASVIPAYDVGGDWYDHAENPDGIWLGVADAMGRGLRSAAVSSVAIGATRAARRAGANLEECCRSVDAAIDALAASTFVTAVLAHWHSGTHTFSWVNCGHPPPLLISPEGAVSELEGEATFPLGLWRNRRGSFTRNERRLQAGDRVMLFSDGVTDRRDHTGEMIGLEGLTAVIEGRGRASAAETVLAVEQHVRSISEKGLADDATQLVLEVRD